MDIDLELVHGPDATEDSVLALQEWLRLEQLPDLKIERKRKEPKAGEMGVDPVTVLSVVLGSKVLVELVKSIHVWLQTRKPKLKLKLKTKHGEIVIDAENLKDQQALIEDVVKRIKLQEA